MSMFDLSPKDVGRGQRIDPPGWYQVRIDSVGELTPSKDGQSKNCNLEGTILFNADSGDGKYEGFPTPRWSYNSKAPGFVTGLLRALGEEPVVGRNDLKVSEGRIVEIFIKDNEYNGTVNSQVDTGSVRAPRERLVQG